ncbi:prepilin-type N-terminal cleavage/methylation domain-containing protein [Desertibacillus haloalkaliphilus]|uniref:prepilin-type N-terminal cleavage/methylation domain-containing protein n=1 Tax=Desertibacillus haloalkaliphilus TaxID=1328930 RepID=UPI001C27B9EF|nr:prepilin-type N-terminal cleavage/methylation domain-containing protein [Desertibacillus haloalkaliphilus]MBU8905055.1 prepilin-type N-terminal cleavage/methylation domain-containing protein [Desertibacillus haloalkaliphilus]
MNRYITNQKGLTLIELLAAISIFAIIVGLVYGVLINGINYSNIAQTKTALQQEANYVITMTRSQHQNSGYESYQIDIGENLTSINIGEHEINNPNINYTVEALRNGEVELAENDLIDPHQPLYIHLIVTDARNDQHSFEIRTTIRRL